MLPAQLTCSAYVPAFTGKAARERHARRRHAETQPVTARAHDLRDATRQPPIERHDEYSWHVRVLATGGDGPRRRHAHAVGQVHARGHGALDDTNGDGG